MNKIKLVETSNYKIGLKDYPELNKIIFDFISDLELRCNVYDLGVSEIEYLSRNGFIANGHNHGGFDKTWLTDLGYAYGSGETFGIGDDIKKSIDYYFEIIDREHKEDSISDDDRFDYAYEYMSHDAIWLGVRCMYEGECKGVHTLMIYAGANLSEYYGPHGKGSKTIAEYEIRFKSTNGLKNKLNKIKKKIESSFE